MMNYYTIPPPPGLTPYVRFFWVLESKIAPGDCYIHRSMADGCAELIFHYQGRFDEILADNSTESSFWSGVHAQSRSYKRFIIHQSFGIFGVYLYPFTLPLLFSVPAAIVSNEMTSLDLLAGPQGRELEEQVMLAGSHAQRVNLVSGFIARRIRNNSHRIQPGIFKTVSHILDAKGAIRVAELAEENNLSVRQFERRFKEFAGFSPKLYARIARFQAITAHYGTSFHSLTDLAYACGYYDQSHFIHDFREFSGHHPRSYFAGKAEGTGFKNI